MNITKDEMVENVCRYEAEKKSECPLPEPIKDDLIDFGRWLLSQKLEQCSCSTMREMLNRLLIRVNELKFEMGQFTDLNYDSYENRIKSVIQLIDELQPVA